MDKVHHVRQMRYGIHWERSFFVGAWLAGEYGNRYPLVMPHVSGRDLTEAIRYIKAGEDTGDVKHKAAVSRRKRESASGYLRTIPHKTRRTYRKAIQLLAKRNGWKFAASRPASWSAWARW